MDVDCGSARDRLGRTLGGKYVLKEVLGAGGTAVVYRAESIDGRGFAIKVLHDHLSRSDEVCRRFVREGQLGNVLDHPGTVRVLDHGSTEEGCPYLVLELLEGESLEDRRVRSGGRLGLWETLEYCDQLLAVLQVAHAKNIVHRDIKPSNLFLTKQGNLKVLDFGIARLVDDTSATSTKTGQMVGTPAFMPPEQALSRPREVDARTDIWSVGATLFTLLSGEHVHIAESSSEHLVKAATLHARSLAKALPGVPANVEALVARCLAFDKNERWPSATAMRASLQDVRNDPGRSIGTTTSPPPERAGSSSNLPTFVTAGDLSPSSERIPVSRRSPLPFLRDDKGGELDVDMSLTSTAKIVVSRRRRWLLPVAVASTMLLVLTSVIVLVFAVQTTTPSRAAVAKKPEVRAGADLPPPAVPLPEVAPAPTPETAAVEPPPPAASASAVRARPPARTTAANTSAPGSTTSTVRTSAPSKKPASAPSSRRDLYRPF